MSTATAEQVVADTVEAAQAVLGAEIEAIFTLGSLAHGGFAPLVSDVDVAIILGATAPDTAERIATRPEPRRGARRAARCRSASRCSGPTGTRSEPARASTAGSGRSIGSTCSTPDACSSDPTCASRASALHTAELVVMSADHILNKFTDAYLERLRDTRALLAGGPRAVTKAILFPVRFMYTLRTGRIGLNDDSARWYAAEGLPGSALALEGARVAQRWDRRRRARQSDARRGSGHASTLSVSTSTPRSSEDLGETRRAAALAERAASVQVAAPDAR